MVSLLLDGDPKDIPDGSTLGSLLPEWDSHISVAVIRPGGSLTQATENLQLKTNAGEVVLEFTSGVSPLAPVIDLREYLVVHWADRYSVAFGPFTGAFIPERRPSRYFRGDLILGCGGYDPSRSYLIFARKNHIADHGAPAGGGVMARVVSGRGMLDQWAIGDRVLGISQVMSAADTTRSFTTNDRDLPLEGGMQVVTHVEIAAWGTGDESVSTTCAGSVEHLLLALQDGRFVVGRRGSTHLRDERHAGSEVDEELRSGRREGTVTVRTSGKSRGAVYIYTIDLPPHATHSVVGQVVHGIEIPRLAREGEVFAIKVTPPRFDLLGLPLEKARSVASIRGIEVKVDHGEGARIVIGQVPGTTLEVLAERAVSLTTIPVEKVIDITLNDECAPQSCQIFRQLTGLSFHDVGQVPFYFTFEDVYLFKPRIPPGVKIIPENLPEGEVAAGLLAITNDSRKGTGLVGVRLSTNRDFGPTSEPFDGTNVIGRVLSCKKLKGISEKEIVYLREVKGHG
jgi:putative methanogenesis marker protein 3